MFINDDIMQLLKRCFKNLKAADTKVGGIKRCKENYQSPSRSRPCSLEMQSQLPGSCVASQRYWVRIIPAVYTSLHK